MDKELLDEMKYISSNFDKVHAEQEKKRKAFLKNYAGWQKREIKIKNL